MGKFDTAYPMRMIMDHAEGILLRQIERDADWYDKAESPIEAAFAMAFMVKVRDEALWPEGDIAWELQRRIEGFRVDFFLEAFGETLVVECDGHDFHERTKKQATKDRSRDRRLQELGHTVFRFTGSEIWSDPMACAGQVSDWIFDAMHQAYKRANA